MCWEGKNCRLYFLAKFFLFVVVVGSGLHFVWWLHMLIVKGSHNMLLKNMLFVTCLYFRETSFRLQKVMLPPCSSHWLSLKVWVTLIKNQSHGGSSS